MCANDSSATAGFIPWTEVSRNLGRYRISVQCLPFTQPVVRALRCVHRRLPPLRTLDTIRDFDRAQLAEGVRAGPHRFSRCALPPDCVTGLSYCAQECDQRTKPQQPERPQCARGCVSNYQRCARIELLQLNTVPQTKGVLAPQ